MSISEGVPGRRLLLIKIFAEFGYADPVQMAKDADAWVWSDQPHDDLTMGDITEGSWPVSEDKKEASPSHPATHPLPATDFPISLTRGRLESAVIARPIKEDAPSAPASWGKVQASILFVLQGAKQPMTSKDLRAALPQFGNQSIFNALRNATIAGRIIREKWEGHAGFRYRAPHTSDAPTVPVPIVTAPQTDPVDSALPENGYVETSQAPTDPSTKPVHEWTSETRAEALRLVDEGYSNKEVAKEMSQRLQEEVSVFKVAAILPKQKAKESTIHRNCLKCQRAFTTDSKYIRMCEGCRKSANDAGML
jgi:hypothetical protein